MKYAEELKRAMEHLAENEKVVFMGQAVADKGTGMTNSLVDIPDSKKIEWTVTEDMQMGASIGMAIDGLIPVSFYPRWNFLCLATNQIVNHLDKMFQMSSGQYNPRVIIRTSIGSKRPLHPQHQHIDEPEQIFEEYDRALNREDGKSTILVEWGDYHGEK